MNRSENFKSSLWSFGDGNSSLTTNPFNVYGAYGKYNVKLVVESCFKGLKDSVTKVQYVKIDSTYDICKAFCCRNRGMTVPLAVGVLYTTTAVRAITVRTNWCDLI